MIQRIQTLFLLGTAILLILILFFPIWSYNGLNMQVVADAFSAKILNQNNEVVAEEETIYISVLSVLSAATAFFTIFQFKNRAFQIRLGLLNILFISGLVGCFFIAIRKGHEIAGTEDAGDFGVAFFLPLIALLFTLLANRFIKNDEKLVRSMDRLR